MGNLELIVIAKGVGRSNAIVRRAEGADRRRQCRQLSETSFGLGPLEQQVEQAEQEEEGRGMGSSQFGEVSNG